MPRPEQTLERVLSGRADAKIRFNDLRNMLSELGFTECMRGSHHIYTRDGVSEIVNLQPKGARAKAYRVKQVRNVILKYQLGGSEDV